MEFRTEHLSVTGIQASHYKMTELCLSVMGGLTISYIKARDLKSCIRSGLGTGLDSFPHFFVVAIDDLLQYVMCVMYHVSNTYLTDETKR